jgi:DTW domain-containing protein YfiP
MPEKVSDCVYRVVVVDATKANNGLARREICLHTSEHGRLIGVQLHVSETKVKRTPIYHAAFLNKRYCLGCGVPQKLCLCNKVDVADASAVSAVILRHPDERKKTLSTVSLIKQRFPEILVKEGENFSPLRQKNLVLVFPDADPESTQLESTQSETLNSQARESVPDAVIPGDQEEPVTLVFLDATWRKAKRMLHENAWLGALPRTSLEPTSMSGYLLRKVPDEHALSTVEVFAILQNDAALPELFKVFMQKQIEVMGRDKYEQNYKGYINYHAK